MSTCYCLEVKWARILDPVKVWQRIYELNLVNMIVSSNLYVTLTSLCGSKNENVRQQKNNRQKPHITLTVMVDSNAMLSA